MVGHLSMSRIAEALSVAWSTANTAVLDEGRRVSISDDERFEGVTVIGVDEHVQCHTRRGDKYVTVIIDLTPVRDGTGTARPLDMAEGRSKAWLAGREQTWREAIQVVSMDGFPSMPAAQAGIDGSSGFKTAAAEEVPQASTAMDPFHVVHLAADALDECRRARCRGRGHLGASTSRSSPPTATPTQPQGRPG